MHHSKYTYDERYRAGYRENLSGYEVARWVALDHFFGKVVNGNEPKNILDYGCGNGLFYRLFQALYPQAEIFGADISSVALEQLQGKYAEFSGRTCVIHNNKTDFADNFFDMVVSIEVMEHVDDLQAYIAEIFRLLKPGGKFIWTTPCANRYSIEHIYSRAKKLIVETSEGYRRWKWEDPGHLRRLTSDEIEQILLTAGFSSVQFRFRAHLFSFVCTQLRAKKIIPASFANYLMKLDYAFFRTLSNAASMIGCATKNTP